MAQLNQLEQQMKEMQQKINQIKQEQKKQEESKYSGPNMKIKLLIANMEFMSDADTLFNKQHGNTLFCQKYASLYQNIEGNLLHESKLEQPSTVTELYFARNPELFQYILDYLCGYNLKNQFRELKVIQLEKLYNDSQYFQIQSLQILIASLLSLRFNPYLKSPVMKLNADQTCVTRSSQQPTGLNQAIAVYGVIHGTIKRFIEFTVISHGNLYVKLGVGEGNPFRITRFPGRDGYPGCSFYCENGNLYRNGGTQPLGNGKSKFGDRIGIGVDLNEQNNTAYVSFFANGTLMKNKLNLKEYMDVKKGVVFVVSLWTANDCVCINQDPVVPESF